jgi:hypothetical protein
MALAVLVLLDGGRLVLGTRTLEESLVLEAIRRGGALSMELGLLLGVCQLFLVFALSDGARRAGRVAARHGPIQPLLERVSKTLERIERDGLGFERSHRASGLLRSSAQLVAGTLAVALGLLIVDAAARSESIAVFGVLYHVTVAGVAFGRAVATRRSRPPLEASSSGRSFVSTSPEPTESFVLSTFDRRRGWTRVRWPEETLLWFEPVSSGDYRLHLPRDVSSLLYIDPARPPLVLEGPPANRTWRVRGRARHVAYEYAYTICVETSAPLAVHFEGVASRPHIRTVSRNLDRIVRPSSLEEVAIDDLVASMVEGGTPYSTDVVEKTEAEARLNSRLQQHLDRRWHRLIGPAPSPLTCRLQSVSLDLVDVS